MPKLKFSAKFHRFAHDFRTTDIKFKTCLNQMRKIILTKNLDNKPLKLFTSHRAQFPFPPQSMTVMDRGVGVGIAQFNLATSSGKTPEMRPLTTYLLLFNTKNKAHLKLFKEGCKVAPQQYKKNDPIFQS